jgi:hypothetical protein
MLHVYDVGLELDSAGLDSTVSDAVGGFVCCFVLATTIEDALERARSAVEDQGFRPIDADHCVRIDLDQYEPEEGQPALSELLSLARPGEALLSTIYTYERLSDAEPS